jgi:hypothetical protein
VGFALVDQDGMVHRWAWFVIAPVVLALGLAAVLIARREGTATGTPPDLSTPVKKECPIGPPDECREFIASQLHVEIRNLPTVAATIDGLQLRDGYVLIDRTGSRQPNAFFEYASSPQESLFQWFRIGITSRAAPKRDNRPIGHTPGGRPFRIVRTRLGTIGLVFNDEHFAYIVARGIGDDLSQTPHELALAERLVDAVQLRTRQVNPPVTP